MILFHWDTNLEAVTIQEHHTEENSRDRDDSRQQSFFKVNTDSKTRRPIGVSRSPCRDNDRYFSCRHFVILPKTILRRTLLCRQSVTRKGQKFLAQRIFPYLQRNSEEEDNDDCDDDDTSFWNRNPIFLPDDFLLLASTLLLKSNRKWECSPNLVK